MSSLQWEATRPRLTRDNEGVIRVWNFCGNAFAPDMLPLAAAYLGVTVSDALIDGLLTLRAFMASRAAAADERLM
jgi:hypothetical protein